MSRNRPAYVERDPHQHRATHRLFGFDRLPRTERTGRQIPYQREDRRAHRARGRTLQLHAQPAGQRAALGLLIPSIDNPYFAHIASIIVHEARAKGYKVILIDTSEDERNEREGVRSLLSRKVDGILIAPAGDDPAFLEATAHQTPVVCIDRHFAKTSLPYVVTDNLRGGREATQHLIDRGHRRILCIQGVRHSIPSADRVRGYRQALEDNGLSAYARVTGDGFSIRNGYEQTLRALHVRQRPTAIFALSNTILLGALKAVREMKLRIPDDISLVSFDNYDYLDYLDPAVTRVGQPSDEIGAQAMEILLQRIAGETGGEEQRRLPPSLIVCRSVRKL